MPAPAFPWRAVLLAPLASVPVVVLAGLGSSDAGLASDLGWGLFFGLVVGLPGAYVGMLLLGIPAYFALTRLGLVRLWTFSGAGAMAALLLGGQTSARLTLMLMLAGALVGAVAYWLLPDDGPVPQGQDLPPST